ncbi:hypothetical protein K1719_004561 [Acacia pycnantha]|nr:hypothetical protein K1719_004561 [Acacia pycnantha]
MAPITTYLFIFLYLISETFLDAHQVFDDIHRRSLFSTTGYGLSLLLLLLKPARWVLIDDFFRSDQVTALRLDLK